MGTMELLCEGGREGRGGEGRGGEGRERRGEREEKRRSVGWKGRDRNCLNFYLCLCSGCYLGIYAIFGASQACFVLLSTFAIAIASFFASKTLHNKMLNNILSTPMSFFDTTPLGRILNRFSKDVNIIDETLPRSVRMFLNTLLIVLSTIIAVSIALPIFLVVIIPMTVFYLLVQVRKPHPLVLFCPPTLSCLTSKALSATLTWGEGMQFHITMPIEAAKC